MKDDAYALMGQQEGSHWWYRSLRRAVLRELKGRERILDVGCGTGGMADHLKGRTVCGLDLSPTALRIAAGKGKAALVRGDCAQLPFAAGCFDAALCLDLLYHEWVADEIEALGEIRRVLEPDGRLVVQLPAFGRYLREHDRLVMGRRRYTSLELKNLLLRSGFAIEKLGYRNFPALFALELMMMLGTNNSAVLEVDGGLPPFNTVMGLIMGIEESITSRWPLKIGLSVWCVAKKP